MPELFFAIWTRNFRESHEVSKRCAVAYLSVGHAELNEKKEKDATSSGRGFKYFASYLKHRILESKTWCFSLPMYRDPEDLAQIQRLRPQGSLVLALVKHPGLGF